MPSEPTAITATEALEEAPVVVRVELGTVSMTVYFHADAALLQATGAGYLLGQTQAQAFRNGYFDQAAQLWNEAGQLLVTTHQVVYYKE